MKKATVSIAALLLMGVIVLCSYKEGPAGYGGYSLTGGDLSNGNGVGCGVSRGCHATAANKLVAVSIVLDSAGGKSTTHYKGGLTYTVKLTGTNNGTSSSLPDFGFQMIAIQGTAASATPVEAGTWATTGMPTSTHYAAAQSGNYDVGVVEHDNIIKATSGTGKSGTIYSESFTWTAPPTGTGPVSFWATINAVLGTGSQSTSDVWDTAHLVINEWPLNTTGITSNITSVNVSTYPNPVVDHLNLQFGNDVKEGLYTITVFDAAGRKVTSQQLEMNVSTSNYSIATNSWHKGVYTLLIENGSSKKSVSVIKQ